MDDEKTSPGVGPDDTQTSAHCERAAIIAHEIPQHYQVLLVEEVEGGREISHRLTRGRTVLGRGPADLLLDDGLVSRKHAAVEVYNEDYILVRDLASTNGTFVNEHLVTQARVQSGDIIRVGRVRLRLAVETCPAAGVAPERGG